MTKINYDEIAEMYENFPTRERTRCSVERVVGSLTDNLRMVKPNRDGSLKRVRQMRGTA